MSHKRETTLLRERAVIREFHLLLRSGADLKAVSMYSDVGKKVFLSARQTQDIVRCYYKSIITDEMVSFVQELKAKKHIRKIRLFCEEFGYCEREGRLIIGYMKKA